MPPSDENSRSALDKPAPVAGDKFAERARPSFLYVIVAILAVDYIVLPLAQIFGSKVLPVTLPADLLTFFGVAVCGYPVSRTAEKVAALPGESEVSLLGLKVGNKPCQE